MTEGRSVLRHVLGYPRLYAEMVQTRRRLRTRDSLDDRGALRLARSLGLGPTQADDEILWLLELLRGERLETVVEIGVDEGGTLFLWTGVAEPDAHLVGLDIRPLGLLGQRSAWSMLRRGFARERQRVELLMPVDSHDPATVQELRRRLDGRRIDFLFIDGDHSYEGVQRDFELYSPLVRPGGLIALHDIVEASAPGVVRFWTELKAAYTTLECTKSGRDQFGIGVVRVPS